MPQVLTRRDFLSRTSGAGTTAVFARLSGARAAPIHRGTGIQGVGRNGEIRVACIGLHGRGKAHVEALQSVPGATVAALCDVDRAVLYSRAMELEGRTGRKARLYDDYRRLLEDAQIDAVSIATPNHAHACIAIAAMQAGKDVYVEKPCSHNLWEGRQLVAAARRYHRVCQHGTQGRSSPALREAVGHLRAGVIGEVTIARAVCAQGRPCVAAMFDEPVPPGVRYELWLGPAPVRAFRRSRFHDYWRWHSEYGNGELGNQALHELDLGRWGLGVGLPGVVRGLSQFSRRGLSQFSQSENGTVPRPPAFEASVWVFAYPHERKTLVLETRPCNVTGLAVGGQAGSGRCGSAPLGVTFYGSEGLMHVNCFEYLTFLGKRPERGPSGAAPPNPFERFIAAVRSRRPEDVDADIVEGHRSSSLCHLGNIASRLGRPVRFDPVTETFPGDEQASAMLTREYRAPFVVPQLA